MSNPLSKSKVTHSNTINLRISGSHFDAFRKEPLKTFFKLPKIVTKVETEVH